MAADWRLSAGPAAVLVLRRMPQDAARSLVLKVSQPKHRSATLLAWSGPALVVAAYLQLAARVARADTSTSFGQDWSPSGYGSSSANRKSLVRGCRRAHCS